MAALLVGCGGSGDNAFCDMVGEVGRDASSLNPARSVAAFEQLHEVATGDVREATGVLVDMMGQLADTGSTTLTGAVREVGWGLDELDLLTHAGNIVDYAMNQCPGITIVGAPDTAPEPLSN